MPMVRVSNGGTTIAAYLVIVTSGYYATFATSDANGVTRNYGLNPNDGYSYKATIPNIGTASWDQGTLKITPTKACSATFKKSAISFNPSQELQITTTTASLPANTDYTFYVGSGVCTVVEFS